MILVASLILTQLKWKPPYSEVHDLALVEAHVRKLKRGDTNVRVDRDVLSLMSFGTDSMFVLPDWLSIKISQIGSTGPWLGQAKMANWNEAFFSYGVKNDGVIVRKQFRAPNAPKSPTEAQKLKGSVTKYSIPSKSLKEDRTVFVYLPPNPYGHLSTIVMADGGDCESFAKVLEPLILSKKVKPVAILGIPSGGYRGPKDKFDFDFDFRAKEYLKVFDPDRFKKHLDFVCDELLPWEEPNSV